MPERNQTPRERAARALCRRDGHPERMQFEGKPMWMSYLEDVDVVLKAALDEKTWLMMLALDVKN